MTETHTPLPCPFCEGDAIIIHEDRVWIECADCPSKAGVGPFNTRAEALTAWNTRADSHHRLVDALERIRTIYPDWPSERVAVIRQIAAAALKEAGRG